MSDHGNPVAGHTPDKLERRPGETSDEHELRLHRDFGIRIPDKSDFPLDGEPVAPLPPDMTLELLTHIRDLLAELVANQTRTSVSVGEINTFSAPSEAASVSEYMRAMRSAVRSDLGRSQDDASRDDERDIDAGTDQELSISSKTGQAHEPETVVGENLVDFLVQRLDHVDGHLERIVAVLENPASIRRELYRHVRTRSSHSNSSPSVDGCGDPTLGDGPVAGAQEAAPATAGTDTPIGIETSPLVVYRTAALQDAVSRRDAVFVRLRNLAAQPPSEFSYEKLPEIGQELHAEQLRVNRCTEHLDLARATEVSLGSPGDRPGKFSNRRRPGMTLPQ